MIFAGVFARLTRGPIFMAGLWDEDVLLLLWQLLKSWACGGGLANVGLKVGAQLKANIMLEVTRLVQNKPGI